MAKIDISKGLRKWAEDTKKEIIDKIRETDTIDTGALLRSIDYSQPRYSGSNKEWFIDFSMLDYGKFTDLPPGKGGSSLIKKSPVPPRNFFHKLIEDRRDDLLDYIENEIYLDIEKKLKNK
jgi:hypothetical protein